MFDFKMIMTEKLKWIVIFVLLVIGILTAFQIMMFYYARHYDNYQGFWLEKSDTKIVQISNMKNSKYYYQVYHLNRRINFAHNLRLMDDDLKMITVSEEGCLRPVKKTLYPICDPEMLTIPEMYRFYLIRDKLYFLTGWDLEKERFNRFDNDSFIRMTDEQVQQLQLEKMIIRRI